MSETQRDGAATREQLLDHEYDGIREYDNPTPGWWHLIFWVTTLFAIPYILVVHFSPLGCTVKEQYEASMAAFYQKKFAKFGDLEPTPETIVGLSKNEEFMSAVKGTFVTKCAACHGNNGAGLVGPNLTDDEYRNVRQVTDIYTILDQGLVSKGMPAWGAQVHPNELVLLTAYVASLRGEDLPDGKTFEEEVEIDPWPDHPRLTEDDFDGSA